VRDNIHSYDLIRAFDAYFRQPRAGAVYNIGGGRYSNCSMLEAIGLCEQIAGREMKWSYAEQARAGDHMWWISDLARFQGDYPEWRLEYDVPEILQEIYDANAERWMEAAVA
jgi:CDP-paratose 2-epimerase